MKIDNWQGRISMKLTVNSEFKKQNKKKTKKNPRRSMRKRIGPGDEKISTKQS